MECILEVDAFHLTVRAKTYLAAHQPWGVQLTHLAGRSSLTAITLIAAITTN
jgi:hypothetical protein